MDKYEHISTILYAASIGQVSYASYYLDEYEGSTSIISILGIDYTDDYKIMSILDELLESGKLVHGGNNQLRLADPFTSEKEVLEWLRGELWDGIIKKSITRPVVVYVNNIAYSLTEEDPTVAQWVHNSLDKLIDPSFHKPAVYTIEIGDVVFYCNLQYTVDVEDSKEVESLIRQYRQSLKQYQEKLMQTPARTSEWNRLVTDILRFEAMINRLRDMLK